jgi:hypothetical protein
MRPGTGVFVRKVRDGEEVLSLGAHHASRDTGAKLEDLAADVPQESVGGPTANEHDGKNRDAGQVHGHGGARSNGVGAHVQMRETKDVGANALGRVLELGGEERGGDQAASVIGEHGADERVRVAAGVGEDPFHHRRPSLDRTEDGEVGGMLVNRLMTDVGFLELKSDGDGGRGGQRGIKEVQRLVLAEEADVAKAEGLRATGSGDVRVLTRAHGKEEGPHREFRGRACGWHGEGEGCMLVHVGKDRGGDSLLLLYVFIEVFVALVLAL